MSNVLFPTFRGLTWNVIKQPTFQTIIQTGASGREVRVTKRVNPIWEFEFTYSILDDTFIDGSGYSELRDLMGFFMQRQGAFDSFLYNDPTDNSVTGQLIATGDGSTASFQLVRNFGGFAEAMQNINVLSNLYLNGASIPAGGLAAPAAPTLSQVASGSLAATTYYVKVTYTTASGETLGSSESSLAVSVNNVLKVTSPATLTGAMGWNVYVSTSTGTETKQNASPIAIGTAWQEPNTGLIAGSALPGANTTGWSQGSTGIVTFQGAPAVGVTISADFTYYFRLRFKNDLQEFNNFVHNLWEAKQMRLISVKV